jgi:hypothetical protein
MAESMAERLLMHVSPISIASSLIYPIIGFARPSLVLSLTVVFNWYRIVLSSLQLHRTLHSRRIWIHDATLLRTLHIDGHRYNGNLEFVIVRHLALFANWVVEVVENQCQDQCVMEC